MKKFINIVESFNFAGQPEQKPGEQWKGTDKGTPGNKLVGSADESVLKDLSKGQTPKTKEQELAEEWANFNEDDLGVEEKRPHRTGSRADKVGVRGHKEQPRYTTVKDEDLTEYKVQVDNFTADDIKELEGIKDLATLKARAFQLVSTPSKRPMKPEKVAWFKQVIDSKTSPLAIIKLMWDLLLSGEGQQVIGSRNSMSANSYRGRFDEATAAGLKVGDHITANTSKGEYPGGHKSRAGKVTRVGQTGVHIRPDDGGEVEYHPYKIVKKTVKDKDVYETTEADFNRDEMFRKHDLETDDLGVVGMGGEFSAIAKAKKAKLAKQKELGEGWNNGTDRVQLADNTSAYWDGSGRLQAEYDELYNQLVPASGAAETLEGEVLRAASKIVYRHFNDGDLFNKASFDQLKGYIGSVTSYDDLAEKAVEYALRAQGNYHPNAGWDSLDVMDYGPEEEEEYDDEDDEEDYQDWEDPNEDNLEEGEHDAEFIDHEDNWYNMADFARAEFKKGKTVQEVIKYLRDNDYLGPQDTNNFMKTVRGEKWNESADMFKAGQRAIKNIKSTEQQRKSEANKMAQAQSQIDVDRENERDRFSQEELYPSDDSHDLDEGASDVYSVTSERNGRERSKSGTLAELIEYYGYTLETGKSYEHERGNRKINLNPKSIESLVQNLNNAKSNAAANGQSNERFYVDHGNMAEGKHFRTAYGWAGGRNEKTGKMYKHPDQIKADREAKKAATAQSKDAFNDMFGGNAADLTRDLKIREAASSDKLVARAHAIIRKHGDADMSHSEFMQLLTANGIPEDVAHHVASDYRPVSEGSSSYPTDANWDRSGQMDPLAKGIGPSRTRANPKSTAKDIEQANYQTKRAIKGRLGKEVAEGWESGPDEPRTRERDPDAEYDARRQEKLDAEADSAPKTTAYQCVGRGPDNKANFKFGPEFATQGEAVAYRKKLMANPKTPNPTDIGIRTISRVAESKADTTGSWVVHSGSKVKRFKTRDGAKAYAEKNGGKVASSEFYADKVQKDINEDVTSTDPLEGALLNAIQELVSQGHKDVDPMVLTNMVVAATSRPFLLKDLVDANNNSLAVQHYIDSISPSKVKFSTDTLTVKNEDPSKDKAKSQAGVSSMASRAANRSRLGEGNETPLQDKEDYNAKRAALQQIQLDPDTAKDPQLKAELARRLGSLNQQYTDLQSKLREFKESRGHKAIATKLGNIDRMQNVQIPSPAERREQLRIAKAKEEVGKKQVKEFAAPGANPAPVVAPANDPAAKQQAQKIATATNTIKSATGSTVAAPVLATALDAASQGQANPAQVKAIAPIANVVDAATKDPKLAGQFKTLAQAASAIR